MAIDIRPAIIAYITDEFVIDETDVDIATANLLEEEIIDSLGIFTLVSFIEDKFGVSIEPEEVNLDNFESVDAIAKLVDGKI